MAAWCLNGRDSWPANVPAATVRSILGAERAITENELSLYGNSTSV